MPKHQLTKLFRSSTPPADAEKPVSPPSTMLFISLTVAPLALLGLILLQGRVLWAVFYDQIRLSPDYIQPLLDGRVIQYATQRATTGAVLATLTLLAEIVIVFVVLLSILHILKRRAAHYPSRSLDWLRYGYRTIVTVLASFLVVMLSVSVVHGLTLHSTLKQLEGEPLERVQKAFEEELGNIEVRSINNARQLVTKSIQIIKDNSVIYQSIIAIVDYYRQIHSLYLSWLNVITAILVATASWSAWLGWQTWRAKHQPVDH